MFRTRKNHSFTLTRYVLVVVVFWTVAIILSLVWNLIYINRTTVELAINEARAAYAKDIVYRSWNAQHGGVYVRITEKTQPNPYLKHPERDLTTLSGIRLTLINPAYMTRLVHELGDKKSGVRAHITSLKLLRPENAADPWEAVALKAFDRGEPEVNSVEIMDGKEYLRLMRPLLTEESCLKCHAVQGYKVGDIRGGISVSIPMQPLRAIASRNIFILVLAHCMLWLLGVVGIGYGTKKIKRDMSKRNQAEEERERVLYDMRERIKELTCMYGVAKTVRERKTLNEVFQDVANLIPSGWQYSEIACASVCFSDIQHVSENFEETRWKQSCDIIVDGKRQGTVEVFYKEERPELYEGPFLKEERNLINGIARTLSETIEHKQVEGELKKYRDHLEELVKKRTVDLEETQNSLLSALNDVNKAKDEIKQANSRLLELDHLKSMFIASMSHELRTPLNSIIGFTGVILQGMAGDINDEQKDQLKRVYGSAKHLLALISDIIDISKIEAGKIQPYVEEFQLDKIIEKVILSLKPQIEDKGLAVKTNIPQFIKLKTDKRRLVQCILNYLSNAIKFTEKGVIHVAAYGTNGIVEIKVKDTGIGIKEEDVSKLFGSFVRLDSPLKTTILGTGLGLYLTKKIATEILEGSVSAESKYGEGSTFKLKIPKKIGKNKDLNSQHVTLIGKEQKHIES